MKIVAKSALAAIALCAATAPASAQEKLKIGLISTLSGPPAVIGQQQRNGFNFGLKQLGGRLGGHEAELIVQDDVLRAQISSRQSRLFASIV